MRHAVERREVVLTRAEERDVADHHHLVVVRLERDGEVLARVLVQTGEDLLVHRRDARGRAQETVALGVLTDRLEDLAHGTLDPRLVDRRLRPDLGHGLKRIGVGHGLFLPAGPWLGGAYPAAP